MIYSSFIAQNSTYVAKKQLRTVFEAEKTKEVVIIDNLKEKIDTLQTSKEIGSKGPSDFEESIETPQNEDSEDYQHVSLIYFGF